ncbi:MAG: carboxypeptidase-like regulatory domain-containing protein [Pirellulales bacterium]
MKGLFGIVIGSAMLLASGCGDAGVSPVTGKVLLPGDVPLVDASVTFKSVDGSVKTQPRGQTDEDGFFEMRLNEEQLGVPPGTYQATVFESPGDDYDNPTKPTIHRRYASFEKSGLQFTVGAGSNHFDIPLDLYQGR